jgi:hypothetical protein
MRVIAIFNCKGEKMTAQGLAKKEYDFSHNDPSAVLTEDELENFDEGMELKNESRSADEIELGMAVRSVVPELDMLFS